MPQIVSPEPILKCVILLFALIKVFVGLNLETKRGDVRVEQGWLEDKKGLYDLYGKAKNLTLWKGRFERQREQGLQEGSDPAEQASSALHCAVG